MNQYVIVDKELHFSMIYVTLATVYKGSVLAA